MSGANISFVTTIDEAIDNIKRFHKHLNTGRHRRMIELLSRVRAWYAVEIDGEWKFGPSKFIGYRNLSPEEYEELAATKLDGRKTEAVLGGWGVKVAEGQPEYLPLFASLEAQCGKFGAVPNKQMRITVLRPNKSDLQPTEADIVNALRVIIATLSDKSKAELKRIAF